MLRTAVGVALLVAPAVPLRMGGTIEPDGAALLLMRTIGVRDLVLGLGTVSATGRNAGSDSRRWLGATLASDALDTAVALVSVRALGRRDASVAAGLAAVFVAGDVAALRSPATPPF